jgi:hypothetical protein
MMTTSIFDRLRDFHPELTAIRTASTRPGRWNAGSIS